MIPEFSSSYLLALNRHHDLTDAERQRVNDLRDDEIRAENAKFSGMSPEWYEGLIKTYRAISRWTHLLPSVSRTLYGILGLDYGSSNIYVSEKDTWFDPEPLDVPDPPVEALSQLTAHSSVLEGIEVAGQFHGTPVKSLNLHKTLDDWEEHDTALRIAYAELYDKDFGPCPPIEKMLGLLEGFEIVCADNVVRRVTTTNVVGYDVYHDDKAEREGTHTVKSHNDLMRRLTAVTEEQAKKLMDEGAMILWNAPYTDNQLSEASGKHYVVDVGTQEVL